MDAPSFLLRVDEALVVLHKKIYSAYVLFTREVEDDNTAKGGVEMQPSRFDVSI